MEKFQFRFYYFPNLLPAYLYKWSQMCQRDTLPTVLVTGHLCYDLSGDIASCSERVRLLDHCAGDDSSVLEHIFQVHQAAVYAMLGEIICIMEVDQTFVMGFYDVRRQ